MTFLLQPQWKRISRLLRLSQAYGERERKNKMENISLVLTRWQTFYPKKLAQFQREDRQEAELKTISQMLSDLIYCLLAERKMHCQAVWERIHDIFLSDEDGSFLTSRNKKKEF